MEDRAKHLNQAARRAPVDLYLAGSQGRIYWPYKLQDADESTPGVRENSLKYMVDSGYTNKSITNEMVLETAYKQQANYVIPNDTVRTDDIGLRQAVEETAEKVSQFLDRVDERKFPGTILIPLQPPHDFHFSFLHKHYPRQAKRSHFALGGMKSPLMTPKEQLQHIKRFRDVAGYDKYIHAFGVGPSNVIRDAVRNDPGLIDAMDCSTVIQEALNGGIKTNINVAQYIGTAQGDTSTTTLARFVEGMLADYCRAMTPSLATEDQIGLDEDRIEKLEENITSIENKIAEFTPTKDTSGEKPKTSEETSSQPQKKVNQFFDTS